MAGSTLVTLLAAIGLVWLVAASFNGSINKYLDLMLAALRHVPTVAVHIREATTLSCTALILVCFAAGSYIDATCTWREAANPTAFHTHCVSTYFTVIAFGSLDIFMLSIIERFALSKKIKGFSELAIVQLFQNTMIDANNVHLILPFSARTTILAVLDVLALVLMSESRQTLRQINGPESRATGFTSVFTAFSLITVANVAVLTIGYITPGVLAIEASMIDALAAILQLARGATNPVPARTNHSSHVPASKRRLLADNPSFHVRTTITTTLEPCTCSTRARTSPRPAVPVPSSSNAGSARPVVPITSITDAGSARPIMPTTSTSNAGSTRPVVSTPSTPNASSTRPAVLTPSTSDNGSTRPAVLTPSTTGHGDDSNLCRDFDLYSDSSTFDDSDIDFIPDLSELL